MLLERAVGGEADPDPLVALGQLFGEKQFNCFRHRHGPPGELAHQLQTPLQHSHLVYIEMAT